MRVTAATYTDGLSGAGIAAMRIHACVTEAGIDSRVLVSRKVTDKSGISQIGGLFDFYPVAARQYAAKLLFRSCGARPGETLSGNFFPTGLHRQLESDSGDVVHLHWIGGEMIRIEEIARLRKPVVWTLHDEWFSLGIEHYSSLSSISGSALRNRRLLTVDSWTRSRKARAWALAQPHLVCPSRWLANRITASGAMPGATPKVIPNPVPLDVFREQNRKDARSALRLPPGRKWIGFGAVKSTSDLRKGYSYLVEALGRLAAADGTKGVSALIFGADAKDESLPLPTHYVGTVEGDEALARIYAAMDVFVCPSTQENLPNTVAEAMACGIPCVAFDIGGLSDLIEHQVTGHLARAFDTTDLSQGIADCLKEPSNLDRSAAARRRAEEMLSPKVIAPKYAEVYRQAVEQRLADRK
jgi:glycosyltransferase involved in cell wall biosynthesis